MTNRGFIIILPRYFKIIFALLFCSHLALASDDNIRPAAMAGTFYPADKASLDTVIEYFLKNVSQKTEAEDGVVGLIVPHAGYFYSGQTAAYGYRWAAGLDPDTVILIGPYHQAPFRGASVWASGVWKTPLGEVPVDAELAAALLKEDKNAVFSKDIHLKEHSLEVQLPFLQKVFKNFKIVPILINDSRPENIAALAAAIVKHLNDKKILIVVSSDMSHYHSRETAKKMDGRTLELIGSGDGSGLSNALQASESELCGGTAVLTFLEVNRLLGNTKTRMLRYSTSADATQNDSKVVGYGALAVYRPTGLSPVQGDALLRIARQTLDHEIGGKEGRKIFSDDPVLKNKGAVFVTLRKSDQLRGCIGALTAAEPLEVAVKHMTLEAARHDPRFPPVGRDEVKDIRIEISVLNPPRRVSNAEEIVRGKHGVIVKRDGQSGIFLPKVADETGWTKDKFMSKLCSQKAGLPPDCWKDKETELYVFTAQDFSERGL